jgi:hypothetical protein
MKSEKGQSSVEYGLGIFIGLFLIALVVLMAFGMFVQPLGNQQTFTATVEKTYIDGGDTFFVLKMPDGSLMPHENADNLYFGKFNSGGLMVSLEVGKTYTFKTVGFRIPFLSCFPNIISADPAGQ